MSALAEALTRAMTQSANDLVLLNRSTDTWTPHPWPQVHLRAENIAERILDSGSTGAVGLVGEPTVEFIAAMQGTWLAGRSLAILPGPVRGAAPDQWASSTMKRFASIGVGAVFAHGVQCEQLKNVDSQIPVTDLAQPGHAKRSTTLHGIKAAESVPAVLQGTAGSTGSPRTAQLSPDAVISNVGGLIAHTQAEAAVDVGCSWLPLYHDMGLTFLLSAALIGGTMWLAPTSAFSASPFRWLNWLSDSHATMTAAPNFAYNVMGRYARRAPEVDLSRLRFAINGGEPIDCEGFDRFASEFARFGFDAAAGAPSYGLAEATCAVTSPLPGSGLRYDEILAVTAAAKPRRHAILGKTIPGMEVRVMPSEQISDDIPGREVGEIEIRGTSMMSGYLGQEAIASTDWFSTGDIGYLIDGELVVCGRAKEIITVAGRNIFPTEVETVAAQVRGVRDGAVAAVEINGNGSRPGLAIAAEFAGREEAGARSEVLRRVASECGVTPAHIVLMAPGSLPRTSSGKLRRADIRQQLEDAVS